MVQATLNAEVSTEKLQAEIADLRQQVEELEQEKVDLETVLEMTTEHSDTVEEELHDKAEEAIKESERRLRMIIEATPVAVVISYIEDDTIAFANAIAGPLAGLSTKDLIGHKVTDFYADTSERARLVELLKKMVKSIITKWNSREKTVPDSGRIFPCVFWNSTKSPVF